MLVVSKWPIVLARLRHVVRTSVAQFPVLWALREQLVLTKALSTGILLWCVVLKQQLRSRVPSVVGLRVILVVGLVNVSYESVVRKKYKY